MSAASGSHSFSVPALHPSLPGHFPGQPTVPGVLILDRVIACVLDVAVDGERVAGLPQLKFLRPLLPEQEARIEWNREGARVRFRVLDVDANLLASGELKVDAA